MLYTIGIDLGGTKIAAALVDSTGQIVYRTEVPTQASEGPEAVMGRMEWAAKRVAQSVSQSEIQGVGIGAPGPLHPRTGMVYSPPNLPGWHGVPLRDELERRLNMRVVLDNDANAAALAEARIGAGVGFQDLVYITISTGIGGGVVMDGLVRQGASGGAAEVGHQIIDINGPLCACGNRGCLETLASGTAIRRLAKERLAKDMDAKDVALLAASGDTSAIQLLDDVYRALGAGLINVIQMYDPSVIVIGGGVAQIGKPLFDALQRAVDNNHFRSPAAVRVTVLPAKLGADAGVVGAALLPRQTDPTESFEIGVTGHGR